MYICVYVYSGSVSHIISGSVRVSCSNNVSGSISGSNCVISLIKFINSIVIYIYIYK